jgi:hypothetical protein
LAFLAEDGKLSFPFRIEATIQKSKILEKSKGLSRTLRQHFTAYVVPFFLLCCEDHAPAETQSPEAAEEKALAASSLEANRNIH